VIESNLFNQLSLFLTDAGNGYGFIDGATKGGLSGPPEGVQCRSGEGAEEGQTVKYFRKPKHTDLKSFPELKPKILFARF
jgi:hypothetical protein